MKRMKKWLWMLTVSGPIIVNLSCTNMFTTAARDATISAVATFVEDATLQFLNERFGLDDGGQTP